tara:strand:+ start:1066 stop:1275 length:210 start_codon:yes stop_codon:yes gene_type:complete
MKIKVNGKETQITTQNKNISLSETLNFLGYKKNTIVVELNNLIINSDKWNKKIILDGDKLEIVSIVGGG